MDKEEIKERCRKVMNEERCKHGMIFEYCALCNEIRVPREYKFPIEVFDDETGDEKTIWLGGVTEDVFYHSYRKSNKNGALPKARSTKPKDLGMRSRTVDSAITKVRF